MIVHRTCIQCGRHGGYLPRPAADNRTSLTSCVEQLVENTTCRPQWVEREGEGGREWEGGRGIVVYIDIRISVNHNSLCCPQGYNNVN